MTDDVHKQLDQTLRKLREAGIHIVGEKLPVESYGGRTEQDEQEMKQKQARRRWYLRVNKKAGW